MHFKTEAVGSTPLNPIQPKVSVPVTTKQPTHVVIRLHDKALVVPYFRLEAVLSSLTYDDLCGIYDGYVYSSEVRKLDPTKISQDLEVQLVSLGSVVEAKATALIAEVADKQRSVDYYSQRASDLEKKLAALQEKVNTLLGTQSA